MLLVKATLRVIPVHRKMLFSDALQKLMDPDKMEMVIDEVGPYIDSIGLTGPGTALLYKRLKGTRVNLSSKFIV
jgi:hypothetical protein